MEYFRTLTRNNTLLSQVRVLAYQSTISANRKREEVLELQRLELVERLKKLDPPVAIPRPKQPIFSYTNELCTADPSDLLFVDDEEEEEVEDDEREVPIMIFINSFYFFNPGLPEPVVFYFSGYGAGQISAPDSATLSLASI